MSQEYFFFIFTNGLQSWCWLLS